MSTVYFFDKHAGELTVIIDLIAERPRTLGNKAPGIPQDVVSNKRVSEPKEPGINGQTIIKNLLSLHGAIIKNVRQATEQTEELKDTGTNDLLVSNVLKVNEIQSWFIRSYLRQVKSLVLIHVYKTEMLNYTNESSTAHRRNRTQFFCS